MSGRPKVSVVTGDVPQMRQAPGCTGALIQVASQFNVLEMTGRSVSPEEGLTRYVHDRTQGPACAVAAGAATIYRNYFVPVAGYIGQTSTRQIHVLAGVGEALSGAVGKSVGTLWQNAQRLCLVPSDRARSDLGPSRETGSGRSGCAARKTVEFEGLPGCATPAKLRQGVTRRIGKSARTGRT